MSGLKKQSHPNTCPGSYEFHAYCAWENPEHAYDEFPHVPEATQTRGEAMSDLRRRGWVLHRDGTATCPKCVPLVRGRHD